jgi:hypothetical protein
MPDITEIDEVIKAVVLALNGVITDTVFDGMPSSEPSNITYVVIGGTLDPNEDIATMTQEWVGLGYKTRREEMDIQCLAVGRASRIPEARAAAVNVIKDVGTNLPANPTAKTYNTLISEVGRMQAANSQAGATVHVQFTIHSRARLLP